MKPRVLIVDDAVERAEVVQTALRLAGCEVATLVPAAANLSAEVERLKPDVISIDVDSPDRIVMMTNGPAATIGGIVEVDLEMPRDRLGLVSDARYHKLRGAVLEFLYQKQMRSAA